MTWSQSSMLLCQKYYGRESEIFETQADLITDNHGVRW
jgi:hypothetical protein